MTSLLGVIRPLSGRTPESSSATSTPWPKNPSRQYSVAPVSAATLTMSPGESVTLGMLFRRTCMSWVAARTPGTSRSAARWLAGRSTTMVSRDSWVETTCAPSFSAALSTAARLPSAACTITRVVGAGALAGVTVASPCDGEASTPPIAIADAASTRQRCCAPRGRVVTGGSPRKQLLVVLGITMP